MEVLDGVFSPQKAVPSAWETCWVAQPPSRCPSAGPWDTCCGSSTSPCGLTCTRMPWRPPFLEPQSQPLPASDFLLRLPPLSQPLLPCRAGALLGVRLWLQGVLCCGWVDLPPRPPRLGLCQHRAASPPCHSLGLTMYVSLTYIAFKTFFFAFTTWLTGAGGPALGLSWL